MTDEDIKAGLLLAERATPGPWVRGSVTGHCEKDHGRGARGHGRGDCEYQYEVSDFEGRSGCIASVPTMTSVVTTTEEYGTPRRADLEFIAAARTLLPEALRELERLRRLANYADHTNFCRRSLTGENPCDCGYDEARVALEGQ